MSDEPVIAPELSYELWAKMKLRKGQSYPVGRLKLDEFFRRERITTVTGVWYGGEAEDGCVLGADYSTVSRHRQWGPILSVSVCAVPSAVRRAVEGLILTDAFPRLADWIRSFDGASLLRAQTDHSVRFTLERRTATGHDGFSDEIEVFGLVQWHDKVRLA